MADIYNIDEEFQSFDINEDHLEIFNKSQENQNLIEALKGRKAFYMHLNATQIINLEIRPRFEKAFANKNDRGRILFLYGDKNTGKSFLVRYSAALCYKKYSSLWRKTADGRKTHPIIIVNIPATIKSIQSFYTWLLDCFGDPVDSKQIKEWDKTDITLVRLRNKTIEDLNSYETRLLIIDESQRLLQVGDSDQISGIFEAFKDLTTKDYWDNLNCKYRSNIVLCGTSDCLSLLRVSRFIQERVHTVSLNPIGQEEYATFLAIIYQDFTNLGISTRWDLFSIVNNNYVINSDIALVLYNRTQGRAGLTVEIIREAIEYSLEDNRDFPTIKDYKDVILPGQIYLIEGTDNLDNNNINNDSDLISETELRKSLRVEFDFDFLYCAFGNCYRSRKQYIKPFSLINHYKKVHPEVEIYDKEGNRLDNN